MPIASFAVPLAALDLWYAMIPTSPLPDCDTFCCPVRAE